MKNNRLIQLIKDQVLIPDYYKSKGFPFPEQVESSGGLFSCQIHGPDTHPSAYYNPGSKSMHCFACGFTGDVIAAVKTIEGITTSQAIHFLLNNFRVDGTIRNDMKYVSDKYKDVSRQSIINSVCFSTYQYIDRTGDYTVLKELDGIVKTNENNKNIPDIFNIFTKFQEKLR